VLERKYTVKGKRDFYAVRGKCRGNVDTDYKINFIIGEIAFVLRN
jgi:hypothetical protein